MDELGFARRVIDARLYEVLNHEFGVRVVKNMAHRLNGQLLKLKDSRYGPNGNPKKIKLPPGARFLD